MQHIIVKKNNFNTIVQTSNEDNPQDWSVDDGGWWLDLKIFKLVPSSNWEMRSDEEEYNISRVFVPKFWISW